MDSSTTRALALKQGPLNALTDVPGIKVGHYTHEHAQRGTTAILCEQGVTAGVSVRGSNPGTVHTDAFAMTTVGLRAHGVGLSGGSLFGLGAISGITEWLLEQRVGLPLRRHEVVLPIIPGAVIYDLDLGDPSIMRSINWGRQAAEAAIEGSFPPDTTDENLTDLVGAAAADAMVLAILDSSRETKGIEGWPSIDTAQEAIRERNRTTP